MIDALVRNSKEAGDRRLKAALAETTPLPLTMRTRPREGLPLVSRKTQAGWERHRKLRRRERQKSPMTKDAKAARTISHLRKYEFSKVVSGASSDCCKRQGLSVVSVCHSCVLVLDKVGIGSFTKKFPMKREEKCKKKWRWSCRKIKTWYIYNYNIVTLFAKKKNWFQICIFLADMAYFNIWFSWFWWRPNI